MRLVHLADLHLGFRQYQRLTPGGINQREADVAATIQRAFTQVIALAPDLVVIGGDIFHSVRPSNPAILHAYRLFSQLVQSLPDTPVIVVAGNHDAPRTSDTGCILRLFREIGVHVADTGPELFTFPTRDLAVLAVPDVPGIDRPPLVPPDGFANRVLLLHGEIEGVMNGAGKPADRAAIEIPTSALNADRWSYIALGHYHVHREVAERAYYSGSVDYTSSNPWGELSEQQERGIPGKGFVEHDLARGTHRFHPVAPTRALIDLDPIDAHGLNVGDVNAAIAQRVRAIPGGIEDSITRLIVRNIPRHVTRDLDYAQLRDFRKRAMHFQLDARRPDAPARKIGGAAPGRRATLVEMVTERLQERVLPPDIDRAAMITLGLDYLRRAEESVAASMPMVDSQ